MMDRDAIGLAVHDISMMVQLLLNTVETLHGNEATPRALEVPHNEGEMLSFVAFDLDKRVNALRDGLSSAFSSCGGDCAASVADYSAAEMNHPPAFVLSAGFHNVRWGVVGLYPLDQVLALLLLVKRGDSRWIKTY